MTKSEIQHPLLGAPGALGTTGTPGTPGSAPGADRATFMASIRAALEHGSVTPAAPPPPTVDESIVRLCQPTEGLLALFAKNAVEVGMCVHPLRAADLIRRIVALLKQLQVRRLATSVGSLPQALGLNDSLRRAGVAVVDWQATPTLDAQYDLDAGITDVHAAIAETGTLVCNSDAGHSRGLSLVPPIHIAIVRKSDILPDGIDFWKRTSGTGHTQLPSSIVLITGPSKTADIEGELITGVHGPGQVHIMLVEDA